MNCGAEGAALEIFSQKFEKLSNKNAVKSDLKKIGVNIFSQKWVWQMLTSVAYLLI